VIGWFGEDVWDFVTDATDVASEVFQGLPVAPELFESLKDFIRGPLRDFAKTPYGMVVFRAMSTTIYGPLAWQLGPQLASFVFALPGIVRGQDFFEAWFDEVQWRAQKTAEVLGADALGAEAVSAALGPVRSATEKLREMVPEDLLNMALSEVADMLGVSDWSAAMALSWLFEQIPVPWRGDFDDNGNLRVNVGYETSLRLSPWMIKNDAAEVSRFVPWMVAATSTPPVLPDERSAPPPLAVGGAPPNQNKMIGDVLLVGVIGAAACALVWFYVGEKKKG
jgi:hypothetical protein